MRDQPKGFFKNDKKMRRKYLEEKIIVIILYVLMFPLS